ncbi:type VII secretion target [Actinoplanes sp. NPDC026670]|uniref:type VII secretion target n=1 Tax=Actinoplanes sp. NPDC026670 TaxID=3154700 RepID=UPI0033FCF7F5
MQPGNLEVDVEVLRGVGRSIADVAATLRENVTAAGSGLAPAARPGSAAGAAAQEAQQVWMAAMQGLSGRVEEYGNSLTTAAQNYRATDEANADGLRRSGAGTGR